MWRHVNPTQMLRLWRTARHLRATQIVGRIRQQFWRPRVSDGPAAARRAAGRMRLIADRPATLVAPETFSFLNITAALSGPAGWNDPARDKLWLYNLHYFDDLNAEGAAERTSWHRALIGRWIAENPMGHGNGWEPYPASLRIVNWIKWTLSGHPGAGDVQQGPLAGDAVAQSAFLHSLTLQVRWLEQRLEWHLLGNHLLANAKALVFAGAFFEGAEADRWLCRGLAMYARELPEQILDDGGHFERSPMYHAIILEDLLDLLNLAYCFKGLFPHGQTAQWQAYAARMRSWLAAMSHPDGRIAFFNDAAFGIAAEPTALEAYAARLGLPASDKPVAGCGLAIERLTASGYFRLSNGPMTAILDCAPIGPDYLPGHAHADTLSFELSLGAERVAVNGGTSVYGTGAERQRQRGTAAHSTVEVDGEDSSEVWAGFRVARRARPRDVRVEEAHDAIEVSACHDGYTRLAGRPVHRRRWRLEQSRLLIADRIEGRCGTALSRLHLQPGTAVEIAADGLGGAFATSAGRLIDFTCTSPAHLEPSTWHPEFGLTIPSQCLVIPLNEGGAEVQLAPRD
jgi:uncharacterized heparinase superfamily protein